MTAIVPEIQHGTAITSTPWKPEDRVLPKAVYINSLPSYEDFFQNIFLNNQLCIIGPEATSRWASRNFWVLENGSPNYSYLRERFGDVSAPIADCNAEEFCSHPKTEMKVMDYLAYWQNHRLRGHSQDAPCLYLKDWHFTRNFPSYCAYTAPAVLCSDWMNEFWDVREDEVKMDDYRFVYMGPKHSWTPFHADVLRSYSWSANICGQKKWIFYPPGEEEKLKDRHGQLVFDLRSDDLKDLQKYPDAFTAADSTITVIQNPGEIIFVPSGWHHQVFNLEDTISINHNWMNGCSVHLSWEYIKQRLVAVQKEIADCEGMDGWHMQCQMILKADSGMDYADFYNFIATIATHRIKALGQYVEQVINKDVRACKPHIHSSQTLPLPSNLERNEGNFINQKECCGCKTDVDSNSAASDVNMCFFSDHNCAHSVNFARRHKDLKHDNKMECSDEGKDLDTSKAAACAGGSTSEGQNNNETVCSSDHSFSEDKQDREGSCTCSQERTWEGSKSIQSDRRLTFLCLFKGTVVKTSEDDNDGMNSKNNAESCREDLYQASCIQACDNSSALHHGDHKSCPHWAHCGPNLALFDLHRVLDIVEDMKGQEEFKALMEDKASFSKFSVPPSELDAQVRSIIKDLV